MNLLEQLEPGLEVLAGWVRFVLESLSVLCVLAGLLVVLRLAASTKPPRRLPLPSTGVRLTFGSWLSMALEFQLGADIVATTTAPTGQHLIQLAGVAVVRTFLNVFLGREIEAEQKLQREWQTELPRAPQIER